MKLCSRFLMVLVEISAKNDKFGYFNSILGTSGVTHDLGWWLVGKPMIDFLFAFIELFSLSITVPELWGEMCIAGLFSHGLTSLHSNFTWTRSTPINHSWHQKTRDTGLPDGGNHIPLRSLVLTQHWNVMDRRTDGYAVAYTALAKLALQRAVKIKLKWQTDSVYGENKSV